MTRKIQTIITLLDNDSLQFCYHLLVTIVSHNKIKTFDQYHIV